MSTKLIKSICKVEFTNTCALERFDPLTLKRSFFILVNNWIRWCLYE